LLKVTRAVKAASPHKYQKEWIIFELLNRVNKYSLSFKINYVKRLKIIFIGSLVFFLLVFLLSKITHLQAQENGFKYLKLAQLEASPETPPIPREPALPEKPGVPEEPGVSEKPGVPEEPGVSEEPGVPPLPEEPPALSLKKEVKISAELMVFNFFPYLVKKYLHLSFSFSALVFLFLAGFVVYFNGKDKNFKNSANGKKLNYFLRGFLFLIFFSYSAWLILTLFFTPKLGQTSFSSDEGKPVKVGDILTYRLNISNTGGQAKNVIVKDSIPNYTGYIPESARYINRSIGYNYTITYDSAERLLILSLPYFSKNEIGIFEFQVQVTKENKEVINFGTIEAENFLLTSSNIVKNPIEKIPPPPPEKCGNNICDKGETYKNCPQDCPPPPSLPPVEESPIPIILKPVDGAIFNTKTIILEGLSKPKKLIKVWLNEKIIQTISSDSEGKIETSLELEEGIQTLFLSLDEKKSKKITITIDLTPPSAPHLLELKILEQKFLDEEVILTLLIEGESSFDTVSIKVFINPEFVFTPEKSPWQKILTFELSAGEHQIYAKAYDLAGNVSQPSNTLIFNVSPPISPTKTIKEIEKTVKEIVGQPEVKEATEGTSQIVLPITTALSLGAVAASVASAGLSFSHFLPLAHLLLFTQFTLFLFPKKRRGWGVVYNSLTKQPIDLAVVRLIEAKTGRLLMTKITDKEGRYAFITDPGTYKIVVDKSEYKFPSQVLKDLKEDFKYLNLYQGQEIEVKEKNTIITPNIPLDPEKEIKPAKLVIRDYFISFLKKALPLTGLVLSFIFFLIIPKLYLLIFFFLHLLLYLLVKYLIISQPKKDWGIVYDKKTKKPLPLAVVRIFEADFNKLLDQQATNIKGEYGFLVGGRKFYLTFYKPGYQEEKSKILDFQKQERGSVVGLDVGLFKKEKES